MKFDFDTNQVKIPETAKPGNYTIEIEISEEETEENKEERKIQKYSIKVEIA